MKLGAYYRIGRERRYKTDNVELKRVVELWTILTAYFGKRCNQLKFDNEYYLLPSFESLMLRKIIRQLIPGKTTYTVRRYIITGALKGILSVIIDKQKYLVTIDFNADVVSREIYPSPYSLY